MMSLFGGLAVAGLGGAAIAEAATQQMKSAPATPAPPPAAPAEGDIGASTSAALDETDAAFSQMGRHPHVRPYHRPRHNPHGRPIYRGPVRRGPVRRHRRRVVRNGRVYWVY